MVTFNSSDFNTSQQKSYFINPGCFGDDVAIWLIQQLRDNGFTAADSPGQEDFGWYLAFKVADIEYDFVIGYRPGDASQEGTWIGWVERKRGFISSITRGRTRGVDQAAPSAIHRALLCSPRTQNVRWHFSDDFDKGREEAGTPEP